MYSAMSLTLGKDFYKQDDFEKQILVSHDTIVLTQARLLKDQDDIIYKMLYKEITKPVFDVVAAFQELRA